ncbi:ABC transporter ATP-binding protein [Flavobacterium faecale]|uniref:ABC transporter ATP-binding protein n=1 Tax=Flavobacterium faecale TaxID=1355330 RepID=A0A2S1LCA7_9FLAO|nr:ABC transporter ATP-binding protein [Flavobacterium faecale]AWG21338.1 ABC transporter ATP-binding protein [Flavobacterium faecale]
MLQINIVEKKYKDQVVLKEANFHILQNGIYGIVGKNGQGKTTLFKCILGFEPFEGSCTFDNKKIVLQDVAWCPAESPIYEELSPAEFYTFYCSILGIENNQSPKLFDVPEDKLVKEFSTGMKKKAFLNALFQKDYPVYILDEPFNGLDIEANYILMNYLKEKAQYSIVLISSHILDVLFTNCLRIFVVNQTTISAYDKEEYTEIPAKLFG